MNLITSYKNSLEIAFKKGQDFLLLEPINKNNYKGYLIESAKEF
jgi:hypothetical protein